MIKTTPVPRLREVISKRFATTVELDPPRGTDLSRAFREAAALKNKVAGINVADSPMANLRMSPIALACLVREQIGIDTVFHLTCRDRSLLGLQSELLGAWAMGVENILALSGDPPEVGDHPRSSGVFDLDSVGLVRLAAALNRGEDANGKSLQGGSDFFIGVASNPAAEDLPTELSKLRAKIAAGAQFSQTQPVYRRQDAEAFLMETGKMAFPVLVGILPIKSHRMLRYLDENVPGIKIPSAVRERIEKTAPEAVRRESVLICQELIEELRGIAAGVHLMPVGDASLVLDILSKDEQKDEQIVEVMMGVGGKGEELGKERDLEGVLKEASTGNCISCQVAFRVAAEQRVPVEKVGQAIQRLGIKIVRCQLGCFS